MLTNLRTRSTYGKEDSRGLESTMRTKTCVDKSRATKEEVYGDLYANPECISAYIAENVSNQFAQSLIENGLLNKYEKA